MVTPKRPTSADVAARAGVSRTTVSFVLNGRTDAGIPEATRPRVLDAAGELGYHPHGAGPRAGRRPQHTSGSSCASRPSRSQTTPSWPRPSAASRPRPGRAASGSSSSRCHPGRRRLRRPRPGSQHVDGLVVSGPAFDDARAEALVDDGFPIILQGSPPALDAPSVDVDNRGGRPDGRRTPARPRPPPDRLHHERAAGLHRGRATGWPAIATRCRRPASRSTRASSSRAPSTPRAASGLAAACSRATDVTALFVASDVVAFGALARPPRGGPPRAGGHVRRRLRRHPARPAFRPAAHDHPISGPGSGRGGRPGAPRRLAGRTSGASGRSCPPSSSSASRRPPRSMADGEPDRRHARPQRKEEVGRADRHRFGPGYDGIASRARRQNDAQRQLAGEHRRGAHRRARVAGCVAPCVQPGRARRPSGGQTSAARRSASTATWTGDEQDVVHGDGRAVAQARPGPR